jgi:hypothetical protein
MRIVGCHSRARPDRFPPPPDSDQCRHRLPTEPPHPGSRSTCSGSPRIDPQNAREFGVGRSEKIGIIGLDTLRALAMCLAAREQPQVQGADVCPSSTTASSTTASSTTEFQFPPAPNSGDNTSPRPTLESGHRSADTRASAAHSLARRRDTTRDASRSQGGTP